MTLYAAFLSMAPFILLAVTGLFGSGKPTEDQEWSLRFLWDVALVVSVVAGGIVSLLVLGDALDPNEFTQDFVIVAGCVSLALLAEHVLSQVRSRYRSSKSDSASDDSFSQP